MTSRRVLPITLKLLGRMAQTAMRGVNKPAMAMSPRDSGEGKEMKKVLNLIIV